MSIQLAGCRPHWSHHTCTVRCLTDEHRPAQVPVTNTQRRHVVHSYSQGGANGALKDTHTHTFNGPFSGTTWVSQYQKEKTNLDFTEARDSEWQWHPPGHMQVCTRSRQITTTQFLQAGCPSCRPTNSVKALKV